MAFTRARPRSSLRPRTATLAPASPRPSAIAPPNTPVAPMTTATSPVRLNKSIYCARDCGIKAVDGEELFLILNVMHMGNERASDSERGVYTSRPGLGGR